MPASTKHPPKKSPRKSRTGPAKWPGIVAACEDLGYSRTHLFEVLEGDRTSPKAIKRYKAWAKRNRHLNPRLPGGV